jgi:nitrite reductase/ring-hydroxylating ferredoxin subunit
MFSIIFSRKKIPAIFTQFSSERFSAYTCQTYSRVCRKHTLRVKSHSAFGNHTVACRYHTREFHIHTHTCQNYSCVSGNHTLHVKSYSACGNRTLRVEISLLRVEITLLSVIITRTSVKLTLVYLESKLCV